MNTIDSKTLLLTALNSVSTFISSKFLS